MIQGWCNHVQSPEHERRHVIRYWNSQSAEDEEVTHAEKIHTEVVSNGRRYDVWDVHATDGQWWVITNMTNLYSKAHFPTMDHALNQHIGLIERVRAKEFKRSHTTEEQQDRLATSWRRVEQANDALAEADESEDFQAVGMRCRECLLAFIREVATEAMVPQGEDMPKQGAFLPWSELVVNTIASGGHSERIRAYLKGVARHTWDMVQWLTHTSNATLFDGEMAVEATGHLLVVFSYALVRYERGEPSRCPVCGSYRLAGDYRPELGRGGAYVTLCEACGWEDVPEEVSQ